MCKANPNVINQIVVSTWSNVRFSLSSCSRTNCPCNFSPRSAQQHRAAPQQQQIPVRTPNAAATPPNKLTSKRFVISSRGTNLAAMSANIIPPVRAKNPANVINTGLSRASQSTPRELLYVRFGQHSAHMFLQQTERIQVKQIIVMKMRGTVETSAASLTRAPLGYRWS